MTVANVTRRRTAAGIAAALMVLGAGPAKAATRVFTIAGTESEAVATCVPGEENPCVSASAWVATDRPLSGRCLARLRDGRDLLCTGAHLVALGPDGLLRQWPRAGIDLRGVVDEQSPVVVAADGSVIAAGYDGVHRISADGTITTLWEKAFPDSMRGMAALSDGRVLVPDPEGHRVDGLAMDGARTPVAGTGRAGSTGDGGLATRARLMEPTVVAARPDGAFVVWDAGARRLRRVSATGRITTLAGGGSGWREGAPARSVDIGPEVYALHTAGRELLLGGDFGVIRIDARGRVHATITGRDEQFPPTDPRGVATDGRRTDDVRLRYPVIGLDVLPGGTKLILTAAIHGSRLMMLAREPGAGRLAVALPGEDRARHDGRITVRSTRAATATLTLVRARNDGVVDRRSATLHPGATTVRLRAPGDGDIYELRLRATAADGGIATHRLTLIGGRTLSRRSLARMVAVIDARGSGGEVVHETRRCRRQSTTRWRCEWAAGWVPPFADPKASRGSSWYTLRPDGLIGFHATSRGFSSHAVMEPWATEDRIYGA